jgi:hypothetical protein
MSTKKAEFFNAVKAGYVAKVGTLLDGDISLLRATDAVKMITQNSFRLYCIFGLIYHLIY